VLQEYWTVLRMLASCGACEGRGVSVAIGEHLVICNWIVDSTETKSIGQPSQSYVGEGPT